ncbi:MAG TPA: GspH/FimT family pseudopilin [Syntrophales bacterium]|nr:GspH/FimT family pseudopilin [Syntrophales bacterium]
MKPSETPGPEARGSVLALWTGRKGPAGFTLLELLIVLTLIGLSFLLVVPRVSDSLANLELTSAVKKAAGSLRYARNQATAKKATWVVQVDFEKNRMVLFPEEERREDDILAEGERDDGKRSERREYVLPSGVRWKRVHQGEESWEDGTVEILFLPTGGCSGGTLEMVNDRERAYGINIDFITGTVRIEDITDETF